MTFTSIPKAGKYRISKHGFADLYYSNVTAQNALHSSRAFTEGDVITPFKAEGALETANRFTVQAADHRHIILSPACLQYTNHSCEPNIFLDTEKQKVFCIKRILPGDELLMFYPASEWDMAEPFSCFCGSPNCLGVIRGAKYLPIFELQRHVVNQHIRDKYQQQSISTND